MASTSGWKVRSIVGQMMGAVSVFMLFSSSYLYSAENKMDKQMNTEKSSMTVRVFKSGLFSAFAHNHEITAPIAEGNFDEDQPAVSLRVESGQLRVVDKDVSDKDRTKIQSTMVGPEVLDTERFPEIRFKSTEVDRLGDGRWLVHGNLTLHGETHPVQVRVEGRAGHYRGSAELKQKDFGITPVRIAGGTVKVKNEVKVEFDIVGK